MNARNPIAGPFVPPHVARFARRRLAEALKVNADFYRDFGYDNLAALVG